MARIIVGRPQSAKVLPLEVLTARERAQRILADAKANAQSLRESAHALGYEAGRIEALRDVLGATATRDRVLAEAEALIVKLGMETAAKLLQGEIEAQPERVLSVVRPLLDQMRRAQRIELRLHPEDAQTVRRWIERARAEAVPSGDAHAGLTVVDEPAMARGGCLVITDRGRLDARVEVQLATIARVLLDPP